MTVAAADSLFRPVSLGGMGPAEVASRLRHLGGLVFFDSALEGPSRTEISIIAAAPDELLRGTMKENATTLQALLAKHNQHVRFDDGLPHGFVTGWVEYDGSYCFGVFDDLLIYRHRDGRWLERGSLSTRLGDPPASFAIQPPQFVMDLRKEQFCEMVSRAQEYIAAGDIYQVNLAHRLRAPFAGDAFAFYTALRHYSPAPYGAFLELGGRTVLSTSPESFLEMSGRSIRTRPIKGTRPRRADPDADQKSAYDLLTSPKEIAELVMITDLERNDLGQVCEWGSVTVPELLVMERYEHVFHLVSTVQGRLRPEVDQVQALQACFPGGSITGAPKKRAREIIAELEPTPRGLYTGAIGWFGFGGESRFSIAIRTVVIEDGCASFHVGAGIVADSVPECEWQETLDKAAGILLAAERCGIPTRL